MATTFLTDETPSTWIGHKIRPYIYTIQLQEMEQKHALDTPFEALTTITIMFPPIPQIIAINHVISVSIAFQYHSHLWILLMYVCMHACIYICMYVERERERWSTLLLEWLMPQPTNPKSMMETASKIHVTKTTLTQKIKFFGGLLPMHQVIQNYNILMAQYDILNYL